MAVQMATFLKGKMNNVVFYQRQGTWVARVQPVTVQQAAATKIRSRNFGIAARAGSALRSGLLPAFHFPKDRSMQIRFSGAIAKWLQLQSPGSIAPLTGVPFVNNFSFNKSTSVAERWKIAFNIVQPADNLLEWQLPSFIPTVAIAAPSRTAAVLCTAAVACCRLADGQLTHHYSTHFSIPYTGDKQQARAIAFPASTSPGKLVLVAVSLTYMSGDGEADTRNVFLPSAVVYAAYF